MKDVTRMVARQYEAYSYPPPIADIDSLVARGDYQIGDPSLFAPMLWPERPRRENLRIFVAGCGSSQAAWLARTNPTSEVTGLDLSEASLAHQRYLQDRHRIKNLKLMQGDILEAPDVGRDFDLVVCTGVLHHTADPPAGMRALESVLARDGALVCMLYAPGRRTGVYIMQDVFRRMGLTQSAEDIAFARRVLDALPPAHFARWYMEGAKELEHDAAMVDTFLHPQDRAYTVPQIFELVEDAGLRFQSWVENSVYYARGETELAQKLYELPDREQWAAMEMLSPGTGVHDFIARHADAPARDISFAEPAWRTLVPHVKPQFVAQGGGKYRRGKLAFELKAEEAAMLDAVDGKRTLAEIGPNARTFFERAWRQGHVMLSLA